MWSRKKKKIPCNFIFKNLQWANTLFHLHWWWTLFWNHPKGQNMSELHLESLSHDLTELKLYYLNICCTHICKTLASLSARWQLRAQPWSFICLDHVLSPPSFTPSQSIIHDLCSSNMRVRQQLQSNIYSPNINKEEK